MHEERQKNDFAATASLRAFAPLREKQLSYSLPFVV
jgi:hypothetical protein